MDLELLRTFRRVAQLKSIIKAAEELFISQSTVISRIRAFEEELKCELFVRNGRGVQLTASGTLFMKYVEHTLEVIDEGIQEVTSKNLVKDSFPLGSVTAVASYFLPGVLALYRKRYPAVAVNVTTASTPIILDWVLNGKIEIGLVRGPFQHLGVESETIFIDPMIPIVSAKHPWVRKSSIMPRDFMNETILASDRKSSIWASIMDWLKKQGITPRIGMEVDHIETTKQMVYHNSVIAFVPSMSVRKELAEGQLIQVTLEPPLDLYRDTILIRHRRKPLSKHAENLWHLLIDHKY
jgi:DNA-binding transcriptional LysR family regulator